MQPEQGIQRSILEYLRWQHIPAMKIQNSGIYVKSRDTYIPSHTVGMSDIYACLPPDGRSCWIEVKTPKGRVTEAQQLFIDTINENGGLAFVAHSVEEVQERLHDYIGRTNQRQSRRAA